MRNKKNDQTKEKQSEQLTMVDCSLEWSVTKFHATKQLYSIRHARIREKNHAAVIRMWENEKKTLPLIA